MISSHYKERQLSFDDTPIFNVKVHHHRPTSIRFLLPCISTEEVDFDYDFGVDDCDNGRESYLTGSESDVEEGGEVEECGYEGSDEKENSSFPYSYEFEDEGIDSKAEKFIAKFYEQMTLQRQISYLEYTERDSKC
ncbi:hypothetical protein F3Y22_tig00111582pilonHSYRG00615 [Hibiscus syriacus]|uniref:Uncharacterized protein n=1 Tax=Hibiscus syriacus TaxID=106335 RepID=A0A6A2XKB3_HIBSY|nr:hypothetical protein F3Y22_tig00111582pilonHSYRG00615 [Hibiscus syriacus]